MSVDPVGTDAKGRHVYDGAIFCEQLPTITCATCGEPFVPSDIPTSARRGPRWLGFPPQEAALVHDRCADAQDAWAAKEQP